MSGPEIPTLCALRVAAGVIQALFMSFVFLLDNRRGLPAQPGLCKHGFGCPHHLNPVPLLPRRQEMGRAAEHPPPPRFVGILRAVLNS